MNPQPLTSDCCKAAPLPDTMVEHCVPGLTWGTCSCCLRDTLYKLPAPSEPPSRSGAGVLIGLGLFMAIACGVTFTLGPVWLSWLTGITSAACGTLAWRQGV